MLDVFLGFRRIQRPEVVARDDALSELLQAAARHGLSELRLANEERLEKR